MNECSVSHLYIHTLINSACSHNPVDLKCESVLCMHVALFPERALPANYGLDLSANCALCLSLSLCMYVCVFACGCVGVCVSQGTVYVDSVRLAAWSRGICGLADAGALLKLNSLN